MEDKELTLEKVYKKIEELVYLEDKRIIDLILAVMLSREQRHSKLWLIIIGNSGIGKSEILELFDNEENTKIIKRITAQTLISGNKNKEKYPDLAPKLRDKVILIPEMAQILNLNSEIQSEIYSQLIDLYDGKISRQVAGMDISYRDLNISLIGCSTPKIDDKFLINQSLGTRQILYRFKNENEEEILAKVRENSMINKEEKREKIKKYIKGLFS